MKMLNIGRSINDRCHQLNVKIARNILFTKNDLVAGHSSVDYVNFYSSAKIRTWTDFI
jgi:hypothetical protein